MNKQTKVLLALLAFALAGCSSSTPQTTRYTLAAFASPPTIATQNIEKETVAIGKLLLPSYLSQSSIALELEDGSIHLARYHRWAEPLREAIRSDLVRKLSIQLPELRIEPEFRQAANAKQRLDIEIDSFHGTESGDITLRGNWMLFDSSNTMLVDRPFDFTESQKTDGYSALVEVHSKLIEKLAEQIAKGVQKRSAELSQSGRSSKSEA